MSRQQINEAQAGWEYETWFNKSFSLQLCNNCAARATSVLNQLVSNLYVGMERDYAEVMLLMT